MTGAAPGRQSPEMSGFEELPTVPAAPTGLPGSLELGAFSVSLSVADLDSSRAFYEKLGFEVTGGAAEHNYLILKNGETTIGLFHGMFEGNILTFNPGLTNRMERLETYTDVRTARSRRHSRIRALGCKPALRARSAQRRSRSATPTAMRCSSTSSSDPPSHARGWSGLRWLART